MLTYISFLQATLTGVLFAISGGFLYYFDRGEGGCLLLNVANDMVANGSMLYFS